MQTVTMDEAKAKLQELLEAAAHGEPFQIGSPGERLITVTAFRGQAAEPREHQRGKTSAARASDAEIAAKQDRRFGTLAGQFVIPDEFDTYMADEIQAMFEGDGKL